MKEMPCFSDSQLEQIARTLGNTNKGLTGTEISKVLQQIRVADTDPQNTKWCRIYNALAVRQNEDQSGDRVFAFIRKALDPVQYIDMRHLFEELRTRINTILSFVGYEYLQDGNYKRVKSVSTLKDAEARANKLRVVLIDRNVSCEILSYCNAELLENNYFHAVLESTKGLFQILREKTGLSCDGSELIDKAFNGATPILSINNYSTESEISEQKGFANLLKGIYGMFRNPTAHSPRVMWEMNEEDALDLFTVVSLAYRRILKAKK